MNKPVKSKKNDEWAGYRSFILSMDNYTKEKRYNDTSPE
jgi:hypothetical protein